MKFMRQKRMFFSNPNFYNLFIFYIDGNTNFQSKNLKGKYFYYFIHPLNLKKWEISGRKRDNDDLSASEGRCEQDQR